MCPPGDVVVDVGADHGRVAASLCAIATERAPHLTTRRPGLRWVVADGLLPFRNVDVAVIAGMGARTISGILDRGPTPAVAVLHAQDDPPHLRRWLAAHGWRIDAERLAPEGGKFAEVLRAVRGVETATGLRLDYGPRLLHDGDPWLPAHLDLRIAELQRIADATLGRAPDVHARCTRGLTFLEGWKSRL